jgi:hypothetical protein
MKITFTKQEAISLFVDALSQCSIRNYGLSFDYDFSQYEIAYKKLKKINLFPAYYDVLGEMLNLGYSLNVLCREDVFDLVFDTITITSKDVCERMQRVPVIYIGKLLYGASDNDDANILLQIIFYNQIMF